MPAAKMAECVRWRCKKFGGAKLRINFSTPQLFSREREKKTSANGAVSNSVGQRPTNSEMKTLSPVGAKAGVPARERFLLCIFKIH